MNRWLSRLSYSFIIIAGFLAFQVYKVNTGRLIVPGWQYILMCIALVLAIGLGVSGIRARHRIIRDHDKFNH